MLAKFAVRVIMGIGFSVLTSQSYAGLMTCDTSNVTVDRITTLTDTGTNLLSQSYTSTSCIGYNPGNDDAGGLSSPSPNIGELGDGLLNGEGPYFTGGEFIEADEFQDLDGDGVFTDPGWVHLGNWQAGDTDFNYSTLGPNPYNDPNLSVDLADFLDIDLTCTDGTLQDCSGGTWSLATDPTIISAVQAILGGATFDHLAISFKSSTGFVVYDFDFIDIFSQEPNLNFLTPYILSGSFNMDDFGGKGISHVNFWARDPSDTPTDVPAPATLALIALGLAVVFRRKRR